MDASSPSTVRSPAHSDALGAAPTQAELATPHNRAVLSIPMPVSVTLAQKKASLSQIVNLVPGSVLAFDTRCDAPLTLQAGETPIATGQTVQIGDRLGLRIQALIGS